MISRLQLSNFGPLQKVDWDGLSSINLIIGSNGSGKTFLLKALYSALRTLEEYKRGDDPRPAHEILAERLHWTFQADKIGDLVTKGADERHLDFRLWLGGNEFCFSLGKDTTRQIATLENHVAPRSSNSIFLPAKEVLSLHSLILESRERDRRFGFDDTYYDLARALRIPSTKVRTPAAFSQSKRKLEAVFGGIVSYEENSGRWSFKKGSARYPMGVTAEGIKKIAILDTLLSNGFLDGNSVVLMDEPESALHPRALTALLDIMELLADRGLQFFLASHSYFVVKKLALMAQKSGRSIPVLSGEGADWTRADLRDGMPDNPIIGEAIRLYEEEVDFALE